MPDIVVLRLRSICEAEGKGLGGGGEGRGEKVSEWQVANMSDYIFDSVLESRCLTMVNKSRNQK